MNRRSTNQFVRKLWIWCTVVLMVSTTLFVYPAQATNEWSQYGKIGPAEGNKLGEFGYPVGVATDSQGNVYVADYDNNRIQKLDVATGEWIAWGKSGGVAGSGLGEFNSPTDIAVDSSDNIYVADKFNHRIQKLDVSTGNWSKWGKVYEGPNVLDDGSGTGLGEFHNPSGVAVDRDGNVYVADTTNQRIQMLDVATGKWIAWGKLGGKTGNLPMYGSGFGEFRQLTGVAVDSAGIVYIADYENHRIQKLKIEKREVVDEGAGKVTYTYTPEWSEWKKDGGGSGSGLGEFNEPYNVEVDSQGNVYVADSYNHRIQKLTIATNEWSEWKKSAGGSGNGLGEFDYPTGVAIDNLGNVYVADYGNHRIQKWGASAVLDYTIAPISDETFSELTAGYASGAQETKSITVTRTGTGDLENLYIAISEAHEGHFEIVEPVVTKLDKTTPSTSFTIKAKNGLSAGTYSATITVKATNMTDVTFTVTQVIKAASKPNPDPNPGPSPDPNPNPTTPPTGPSKEEIMVDVRAGEGEVISKTPITRTTEQNGKVKDEVTLTPDRAKESADQLKNKEDKTARIVIPDEKDKVSQVDVKIPTGAVNTLANGKANVEIYTENVRILIPNESLNGFDKDLYFRLIPIKKEEERKEVETRAKKEEQVREIAKDQEVKILGRPMTIETNMQSRPVTLILPLKDSLPKNEAERQKILDNLVIFIEHSDGTKELLRGELVTYKNGELGVQFNINKFSTFTMVYMEGWKEYFDGKQQAGTHKPYIHGYLDGTFGPEKTVTRAQMAAMLARNLGIEYKGNETPSYTDATSKHWAFKEIEIMKQQGIMMGRLDGSFGIGDSITRAEMATIVDRWMIQQGKTNGSHSDKITYTDLSDKHWAYEAIMRIRGYGIMEGSKDHTFKPDQKLTRAEAVKVLNRLFNRGPLYGVDKPSFTDVPNSYWAFDEIEEAAKEHQWKKDEQGREIKK